VTATNPNVNIVQWFAENIYTDLQVGAGGVNPVLQVDAIRYLYTFRNQVREGLLIMLTFIRPRANIYPIQLTKEQLVSVLPLLSSRLESHDVVVYTYAAVALDRVLSMRVGESTSLMCVSHAMLASFSHNLYRFSSADVQPFALQLLDVLLAKIDLQASPERVAENDFLMRCASLVLFPTRREFHCWPVRCHKGNHHRKTGIGRRICERASTSCRHSLHHFQKPEQSEL
jgi:exportin-2 (importin alpha re-exporter)